MSSDVIARAEASKGGSSVAIYAMVSAILKRRQPAGGTLIDVGCGQGELRKYIGDFQAAYAGADVVRYEGFPADVPFYQIDLDAGKLPLPDGSMDMVVAVETIEHLENPRAFVRELYRLVKPGGLVIVTTPNQLSLLSHLTLITKGQFNHFQEAPGLYPAHITALLPIDFSRIAQETKLREIEISFSNSGRVPMSGANWPSGFTGRLFSDNMAFSAIK